MATFKPGDRVWVDDPGLAALRDIMRSAGIEPQPNHVGSVDHVEAGYVYIVFDDGIGAPYPTADVHHEHEGVAP